MASLTQTPNGTWRAQIEHRGKREYKTFPNKTLASQWARQREAEIARGLLISIDEAAKTPISEVIKAYRENELPKKRNRSDKWILNTLDERFGITRLAALRTSEVAKFRDDRLRLGRAPATVVKELNLLRQLIDYAIGEMGRHLPENVARKVKNPKVANERDRVFRDDEEKRLFAAMNTAELRNIATLALETAARLGELLHADWRRISLEKRTITFPLTKTDKKRTVPLSTAAIETLQTMKPRKSGRLFSCWAAGDSFQNTYSRALARARKAYERECEDDGTEPDPDLLVDLHFHDLRHIATSRLARFFPNVIELSMITGHTDLKMLKRYYHVSPEDLARRLP